MSDPITQFVTSELMAELAKTAAQRDELLAALRISTTALEVVLSNDKGNIAAKCSIQRNRAAIARAEVKP